MSVLTDDFAHCYGCDVVLNLGKQHYSVIDDELYCENCDTKELIDTTEDAISYVKSIGYDVTSKEGVHLVEDEVYKELLNSVELINMANYWRQDRRDN